MRKHFAPVVAISAEEKAGPIGNMLKDIREHYDIPRAGGHGFGGIGFNE
jgi:hypothetical protein